MTFSLKTIARALAGRRRPDSRAVSGAAPASPERSPFEPALSFEAARIDLALASERRAWRAARWLAALLALEAVAIAAALPLKSTVPYVIELDRASGAASILEIADARSIPASDVQDKYWLAQYVLARESYDYRTLENDFIKTRELSSAQAFAPYAAQFGQKEGSLERLYGDAKQIRVSLISVVPNGNGIATVRFKKTLQSTQSGLVEKESLWTATMGYEYQPRLKAPEASRLVNPFGFRVTSYRTDEELGRPGQAAKPSAADGGAARPDGEAAS